MMKIVKKCLIAIFLATLFAVIFCVTYISINLFNYQSLPLNVEAFSDSNLSVNIFAKDNTPIEQDNNINGSTISIEKLQNHTKQAFLAIEDKEFYTHNGINKKRIAKALWNNITSGSMKEGASTISQQLIKNTHLTNEKTIKRKLKEIALTQKLEKEFSKDEILENYLNIIFFGNNCYGIENASKYYFNKDASNLTLEESCTLAGIIKSPSTYNPLSQPQKTLQRRNLILEEMEKDGYITASEKITAQNLPINLDITPQNSTKINSYSQESLEEASKILKLSEKQIALKKYEIHTYFDKEKQTSLEKSISKINLDDVDSSAIVINNATHGICAYKANSNFKLLDCKRQPASTIKPLLVFAPALNENVISPQSQILDEPLKIGDYEPQNINKKYSGYISVSEAVQKSTNIPAIKVLSYIGIDTGKQYATKMGINFDEKDDSYALALGGMTYGTTLKELTSAYTTFANKGNFAPSTFVQYITDSNGKIVYMHKSDEKMVFREDSAYLMTDMLIKTTQNGTAKKLSTIKNTQVASKTGTVGKNSGNTDAYDISITPEETIGVWFGSADNIPKNIAGGNQSAVVARDYIQSQTYTKTEFEMPSTVTTAKIDILEKEQNHKIVLASKNSPDRYVEKALFSRFNLPNEISTNFSQKPQINADCKIKKDKIYVNLKCQKQIEYQIYQDDKEEKIVKETDKEIEVILPQNTPQTTIKITAKYNGIENKNLVETREFQLSNNRFITPTKPQKKWYL